MARPACSTLTLTIRKARNAAEIAKAAALYVRAGTAAFTWRPAGHFNAEDFVRFAEEEEVWLAFRSNALVGILSLFRSDNFIHCQAVSPDAQRRRRVQPVDHLRSCRRSADLEARDAKRPGDCVLRSHGLIH
jgi:hypothetical protein